MRKFIYCMTAAAFLGTTTFAAVPARASDKFPLPPGAFPLAIGVLPAMLVLGTKENKKFKAVNPYEKKSGKKAAKKKK